MFLRSSDCCSHLCIKRCKGYATCSGSILFIVKLLFSRCGLTILGEAILRKRKKNMKSAVVLLLNFVVSLPCTFGNSTQFSGQWSIVNYQFERLSFTIHDIIQSSYKSKKASTSSALPLSTSVCLYRLYASFYRWH